MRKLALGATGSLLAAATLLLVPVGAHLGADTAHAKKLTLATKTFRITSPDEKQRMVVRCPGSTWPLGGGMISNPPPGPDGHGAYPHSYERLGVQQGFHSTPVLFSPNRGSTQAREVTLQVMCGRRRGHVTPPHKTTYVSPGETKTVIATCPGRRHLFSGGFQRTDFTSRGGNFVTQSRAISSKSWAVTGSAFGSFGGELTAIAYCLRSKKPLLQEVSAATTVDSQKLGTARTPSCGGGRRLTVGGFSTFPQRSVFFTDGMFNSDGSWSASGFNNFGPAATLTAYGYCLKP